jgi:hypothetical protein
MVGEARVRGREVVMAEVSVRVLGGVSGVADGVVLAGVELFEVVLEVIDTEVVIREIVMALSVVTANTSLPPRPAPPTTMATTTTHHIFCTNTPLLPIFKLLVLKVYPI